MKKLFLLSALTLLLSAFAFAQDETAQTIKAPKWISDRGYWVVENNVHTPKTSTVYFYTNENVLVYKEKVEGIKIRLKKKSVLMRLKGVLEQSVTAWEAQHISRENEMLVAVAFRK